MPYSPKLLLYGRDLPLLETRQRIFQYAGFTTGIAEDVVTFRAKLREGEVDLLILCHSLFREDWDVVRRAAQNSRFFTNIAFSSMPANRKAKLQKSEKSYDDMAWTRPDCSVLSESFFKAGRLWLSH